MLYALALGARIVGEQAKHDPHQKLFEIVAPVTGLEKRVVKPAHQFGDRDVDRVLITERALVYSGNEAERLDMAG